MMTPFMGVGNLGRGLDEVVGLLLWGEDEALSPLLLLLLLLLLSSAAREIMA